MLYPALLKLLVVVLLLSIIVAGIWLWRQRKPVVHEPSGPVDASSDAAAESTHEAEVTALVQQHLSHGAYDSLTDDREHTMINGVDVSDIITACLKTLGGTEGLEIAGLFVTRHVVVNAIVNHTMPTIIKNVARGVVTLAEDSVPNILSKIGSVLGREGLAKVGIVEISEEVGIEMTELATDAAAETVVVGANIGVDIATDVAVGAAAAPVGWILLAADAVNLVIDHVIDPGGYKNFRSSEALEKTRDMAQDVWAAAVREKHARVVKGPPVSNDKAVLRARAKQAAHRLLAGPGGAADTLRRMIESGQRPKTDVTDPVRMGAFFRQYMDIHHGSQVDIIRQLNCEAAGGKFIRDQEQHGSCSYRDAATCLSSYSWPPSKDIPFGTRWNDEAGQCEWAPTAVHKLCDQHELAFNPSTGSCKFTEKYCRSFGGEFKDGECYISGTQKAFEAILGRTVLRGLKSVFDTDNYEQCKPDETDLGYACVKVSCPADQEHSALGLFCYDKCDVDHPHGVGPVCWAQCDPNHETDTGIFCMDQCKDDYDNVLGVCWQESENIGMGKMPNCPTDWTSWGLTCHEPISGGGCHGKNCLDYEVCTTDQVDWGCFCCDKMHGGRLLGRLNGDDRTECDDPEDDKIGGLCYKSCAPAQTHNSGMPYLCSAPGPISYIPPSTAKHTRTRAAHNASWHLVKKKKKF